MPFARTAPYRLGQIMRCLKHPYCARSGIYLLDVRIPQLSVRRRIWLKCLKIKRRKQDKFPYFSTPFYVIHTIRLKLEEALVDSPVANVEVTMNTPEAAVLIQKLSSEYGLIHIGAGTVLT